MTYTPRYLNKHKIKAKLKNKSIEPFFFKSIDYLLEDVFTELAKNEKITREDFFKVLYKMLKNVQSE